MDILIDTEEKLLISHLCIHVGGHLYMYRKGWTGANPVGLGISAPLARHVPAGGAGRSPKHFQIQPPLIDVHLHPNQTNPLVSQQHPPPPSHLSPSHPHRLPQNGKRRQRVQGSVSPIPISALSLSALTSALNHIHPLPSTYPHHPPGAHSILTNFQTRSTSPSSAAPVSNPSPTSPTSRL